MENGNLNGLDIQIGHPEFISGSHLDNNEMLKRVQHDVRRGFTRPSSFPRNVVGNPHYLKA